MTNRTDAPMAGAEALLWTMGQDPVLRSTIVAVLVLDHAPEQDDVRQLLQDLAVAVPRLHWRGTRTSWGLRPPRWTADDRFDIDQHLRRVAAPAPGTVDEVLHLAQAMAGAAFDPELPLWEALVVEGMAGGQAAIVLKIHHAVVDGVGGLAALLKVTEGPRHRGERAGDAPAGGPSSPLASLRRAGAAAARVATQPAAVASALAHDARTVWRLLAPAPRPRSPLARGRGVIRRFGVLDLALADLRHSARALDATVNDVFVAGVLGGLERYHELHGSPVATLRGLIPVSIRSGDDEVGSNRFVPTRFLLPAGEADPATRVRRVHEILGAPVHDPALRLSDAVAALLCRLPAPVATAAFGSMLKGSDFVATNVPGPRAEVRVAGARLQRIYAFSPPTGAGCNVSLVSVGRHASLGVNVDTQAIPDHTLLLECLRAAFAELVRLGRAPHAPGAEATGKNGSNPAATGGGEEDRHA